MKIKKKDIKKWCEALRSGKYSQTTGTLNNDDGFCCLGVACDIFIPKNKINRELGGFIAYQHPYEQEHSPIWLKNVNQDFKKRTERALAILNDSGDFSFDDIADLLEAVYIHEVLND